MPGAGGESGAIISPQGVSIASWVIAPASKASRDADPAVRRAGVGLLGSVSMILADKSVAAPLAAALKDEDSAVRRTAAQAMVNVARFAPDVTAALSAAVNDRDQAVRVCALRALGSAGSAAKDAMPVITAALKDPDPQVRVAAANALGGMQMQASLDSPQGPGYTPPGFAAPGSSPFGGGSSDVLVQAANLWHYANVRRPDMAKSEADKLVKHGDPQMLLGAFMRVAQERHEDLSVWLKHNRDVAELKELVALLDQTMKQMGQPPESDPAAPGGAAPAPGAGPATPASAPAASPEGGRLDNPPR
jgi:hypothetical protein